MISMSTAIAPRRTNLIDHKDMEHSERMATECNVNICFAIDGSGSINRDEFEIQKDLILDVVSVISTENAGSLQFAAVQYGTRPIPISPLTTDFSGFLLSVARTLSVTSPSSSLDTGIAYCEVELMKQTDANSFIVLLGDFRDNSQGHPVTRAGTFRKFFEPKGRLDTVGVGIFDSILSQRIAGAGGGKAFEISSASSSDVFLELSLLIQNACSR
ncbi:unnamed protein product [Agarophyton chilense]